MLARSSLIVIYKNSCDMHILKKHSYEHKNESGRTLFLIEVYVYDQPYVFNKGFFECEFEENIDRKFLKSNEFLICISKVLIHMPYDITEENDELKKKIHQIERMAIANIHSDLNEKLFELGKMIEDIPYIEKIYAPEFAIDTNGNYDESYMLDFLNKEKSYNPLAMPITIGAYTDLLFQDIIEQNQEICPKNNLWAFNCIEFALQFFSNHLQIKSISIHSLIQIIDNSIIDVVLEYMPETSHYLYIEPIDQKDPELVIAFVNKDNKILNYFFLLRELD